MHKMYKKFLIILLSMLPVVCFAAKKTHATIAINERTGAYSFDKDSSLVRTESDAIKKCEKMAKQLNKTNGWKYSVKDRKCDVILQLKTKQCAVLAANDGAFGWTIANDTRIKEATRRNALNDCQRNGGGRGCKVLLEVCTK